MPVALDMPIDRSGSRCGTVAPSVPRGWAKSTSCADGGDRKVRTGADDLSQIPFLVAGLDPATYVTYGRFKDVDGRSRPDEGRRRTGTMTARVVFTAVWPRCTGGVRELTVEARNLRGVIKAWISSTRSRQPSRRRNHRRNRRRAPRDRLFPADSPGLQIFFIPKLEGG